MHACSQGVLFQAFVLVSRSCHTILQAIEGYLIELEKVRVCMCVCVCVCMYVCVCVCVFLSLSLLYIYIYIYISLLFILFTLFIQLQILSLPLHCMVTLYFHQDARYVLSVKAHEVRDGTLLSFPKNGVVALSNKPVDKGVFYCYMYLLVYSYSGVCLSLLFQACYSITHIPYIV